MLADEVKEIVRELARSVAATSIEILACAQPPTTEVGLVRALGGDRYLIVTGSEGASETNADAELERAARALRSACRRWDALAVPLYSWPDGTDEPSSDRVRIRIETYLAALRTTSRARNVLITVAGEIVASATDALELEQERVSFTLKQVAADAASRSDTSFGEVSGTDFYARSFWVNAAMIIFFEGPWALDFVRHRARNVCRELVHLLGSLEPPPAAPASIAPIPE